MKGRRHGPRRAASVQKKVGAKKQNVKRSLLRPPGCSFSPCPLSSWGLFVRDGGDQRPRVDLVRGAIFDNNLSRLRLDPGAAAGPPSSSVRPSKSAHAAAGRHRGDDFME